MKPAQIIFFLLLAGSAIPGVGPGMSLAAGILFSLLVGNPWPSESARWSKRLLQVSVVGLGFGVEIGDIWHTGREAVLYTPLSIAATVGVGLLLGRMFRVPSRTSSLISFGTAICGGSAIAAMAPVVKAKNEEIAVSLATIFSLNAAALLVFPPLGHLFGLTQRQFGFWSALAIHDTSSVVGASAAFGGTALAIGTTVKLARAVWISPSVLLGSFISRSGTKASIPLFIVGFIAAASLRSLLPNGSVLWNVFSAAARHGLVVTLFLVGNGLTKEVLNRVGVRPLLQGVVLWVIVCATTLAAVVTGIIG